MADASSLFSRVPFLSGLASSLARPLGRLFGGGRSGNRFILSIGDEGATLVQIRRGQVVDALFVAADAEDGPESLRDVIAGQESYPILLLADVVEQMFREDTMPKVGVLDRGKVVRRRLDLAYPNDLLKGAMALPRARGAPQSYMLTALPMSPNLERWVAFLEGLPNPVQGFYLLPLEVLDLAQKLGPSTAGEARATWRALITQQAASGYRQVFETGGKLMVTRLTQRQMQEMTPDAEAMLIERELRSSISYVKRLGFNEADRLDVILLADPAVCRAVDERDLPATSVTSLTPYQAGVLSGLGDVGPEDTPYSDVLLGLWVAAKRRRKIVLPTPVIRKRMLLGTLTRWGTVAAAAATLLAVYYTGSFLGDYFDASDQLSRLQEEEKRSQLSLSAEMAKVKNSPIPLEVLTEVAQAEDSLSQQQVDFVPLMRTIAGLLDDNTRLLGIWFGVPGEAPQGDQPQIQQAQPQPQPPQRPGAKVVANLHPYELHLRVNMAAGEAVPSPDAALLEAKSLLAKLVAAFPGYRVEAVQLPATVRMNQLLEGSAATPGGAAPKVPEIVAEYLIRKET